MSRTIPQSKPLQLISTTAAAKRLSISPNAIRQHIADGKLKGYKVGRLVKLNPDDVERFIKEIDAAQCL